jgi:hypothetical protein
MSGWTVKYDGPCSKCGTVLPAGTAAVWDRRARKMFCLACAEEPAPSTEAPKLDIGVAGGSARARHERLRAKRDRDRKERFGERLGGFISWFADEPQSIRAWGIGAAGEELLGKALLSIPRLVALHDRRVPGTRGNIDHLVVAPAGVFVVDAKHYQGTIEVVDRGGFFRTDLRLTVGGRDKSSLADGMEWQVKAVIRALTEAGVDPLPPVTAVLCFIDGNWPLFRPPKSYNGVLLESERSLARVIAAGGELDEDGIQQLALVLSSALPPMSARA